MSVRATTETPRPAAQGTRLAAVLHAGAHTDGVFGLPKHNKQPAAPVVERKKVEMYLLLAVNDAGLPYNHYSLTLGMTPTDREASYHDPEYEAFTLFTKLTEKVMSLDHLSNRADMVWIRSDKVYYLKDETNPPERYVFTIDFVPKDEFTYEVRKLFSLGDTKEKVRMFASQVEPADSTPVPMRRRLWR